MISLIWSYSSYNEELSWSQEEVRRLQGLLAAARSDCIGVSEERLQLQQENIQLHKEMNELRKASIQIQREAKQKVTKLKIGRQSMLVCHNS